MLILPDFAAWLVQLVLSGLHGNWNFPSHLWKYRSRCVSFSTNPFQNAQNQVIQKPYVHLACRIESESLGNYHKTRRCGRLCYSDLQSIEQMHADFANSKLHPGDLKETVSKYLIPIVTGLAQKFSISDEARRTILDRST